MKDHIIHFEDKPFFDVHAAISHVEARHGRNLTPLERAVLRHAQSVITAVYSEAKRRHYAEQETKQLATETATCL